MSTTEHEPQSTTSPAHVRDRLLDAAEEVVGRDGVNNLTLSSVAAQAGVSKGGLLYHFPSKSALITAIVERMATTCEANHGEALRADADPVGRFTRAYLTTRMAKHEEHRANPIGTALLAAAGTDPQYLEPFRRRHEAWQTAMNTDGIDPAVAAIVRLAIDGLCLGEKLGMPVPQGELRQQVLDKLIALTKTPKTNQEVKS
jgi:AcrR family transcriptional regulator